MSAYTKGDLVQVLDVADASDLKGGLLNAADDEINAEKFIGRVGRVVDVRTHGSLPVGNTNRDPLYIVEVPLLGRDGFWAEELRKLGG